MIKLKSIVKQNDNHFYIIMGVTDCVDGTRVTCGAPEIYRANIFQEESVGISLSKIVGRKMDEIALS